MAHRVKEGMRFVRFILVWSSLSPAFLLWAVRGSEAYPDWKFTVICLALFSVPNALLIAFWARAKDKNVVRTLDVIKSDDPKDHILTYLFAMLIPLYQSNMDNARQMLVAGASFAMIMFLFWHMKLHYMNFVFALGGYNIFTVKVKAAIGGTSQETWVVISRRATIPEGEILTGFRLGGLVLADKAA